VRRISAAAVAVEDDVEDWRRRTAVAADVVVACAAAAVEEEDEGWRGRSEAAAERNMFSDGFNCFNSKYIIQFLLKKALHHEKMKPK
jgi:hypothetical protein